MDTRDRAREAVVARVQRAMEGQAPATPSLARDLDALFAAQQPRIYAVCLRMMGDPERAREVAQDAMMTAWRKLPEFRGQSSFGTWLYGIARHLCFNAMRKSADLLTEDGVIEAGEPVRSALSHLQRHEREEVLRAAAAAVLDPLEQEAVHLRYVERIPQDRITEILGLDSATGARGLLQRCRRKLRRELQRRLEELGHGTSFVRGTL